MKTIILLFLIFGTMEAIANSIVGNQNCSTCTTLGPRTFDFSKTTVKKLQMKHDGLGFDVGVTINGTSMTDYVVPANTKAVILGWEGMMVSGSPGGEQSGLLYGDIIRHNNNNAMTNPVYCGGGIYLTGGAVFTALGSRQEFFCNLVVPSGKYIHTHAISAGKQTYEVYIGECPDTGACEFE